MIQISLRAQQGANLEYMSQLTAKVENALAGLKGNGEITGVLATVGAGGTNSASVVASLADWSQRERTQQQVQAELQRKLSDIPGLAISLRSANSLGIRGGGQGLRFAIAGPDYDKLADTANKLASRLATTPGFRFARTDYDTTQPQLSVQI